MIKSITLLIITVLSLPLAAQDFTQGKVAYNETMFLNLNFEDDDNPEMAQIQSMLPSSQSYKKELLFKDGKSIYRDTKEVQEAPNQTVNIGDESSDMQLNLEIARPDNIVFKDWNKEKVIQKRDFMGREFLITGFPENNWKITDEVKEIIGYKCIKAVLEDSVETVAWYTSEIPVFTGPEYFYNLPGLVLELSMNDGERVISATEITFEEVEESIVAPAKGKRVSREEFIVIADKKLKEMQAVHGGSGRMIMIREEN